MENLNHCSWGGRVDESQTLVPGSPEMVEDTSFHYILFFSESWLSGLVAEWISLMRFS